MSKKIKIIISIAILTLCIALTQRVFAIDIKNLHNTDYWNSGKVELLPQPSNSNLPTNSAIRYIFCIQKGHALRFSPDPLPEDNDEPIYTDTIHTGDHCDDTPEDAYDAMISARETLAEKVKTEIAQYEQSKAGVPNSGVFWDYGHSTEWNYSAIERKLFSPTSEGRTWT